MVRELFAWQATICRLWWNTLQHCLYLYWCATGVYSWTTVVYNLYERHTYGQSKFKVILYADDTNLISTLGFCDSTLPINNASIERVAEQINIELSNIQEWLNINKLSLNVKKTKFMIFHHYQRNIKNIIPTLKINSETIENVNEFYFLGLTIDEHLNWKPHIQKISNKIARTLGIMCRLKNFLPTHILRVLYNSLNLPHLQYSILAWGFKMGRLDCKSVQFVSSHAANIILTPTRYFEN